MLITNYDDFLARGANQSASLFWIVEYSPSALGYNQRSNDYLNSAERYSLFRRECLEHPQSFRDRLNTGAYRIWTETPVEKDW